MKCQKCGANNANTHVKTIINGEFKEYDLCSDCAKKMGLGSIFNTNADFSKFSGDFYEVLGFKYLYLSSPNYIWYNLNTLEKLCP